MLLFRLSQAIPKSQDSTDRKASTISYRTSSSFEVTVGSAGYHYLVISLQSKNEPRQRPPFVDTAGKHKISLITFYSMDRYQDSLAKVA